MIQLTERYTQAFDLVRLAHASQVRKGSQVPYLYHLMAVSSMVLEFGGSEDQAIAGLLHDLIEDCGDGYREQVRRSFGDTVARIVDACTDGSAESKGEHTDPEARRQDWLRRKLKYLKHLREEDATVLLVSACDKLHNARAIVSDLENPDIGLDVFKRFTSGQDGTLRYYHSLAILFSQRHATPARQMEATVARMHQLAGVAHRLPLEHA
jgi:(p)ppGpp synthase/HD superfamily hydrolase